MAESLSGGARRGYEYLAGLWSKGLHLWLLWSCRDVPRAYGLPDRLQHATGSEFIAPSWSWASQSQFVTYEIAEELLQSCCAVRITETVVEVDGLNPYGRVKNASLRVRGEMRDMPGIPLKRRCVLSERPFFQCEVKGDFTIKLWLDWMEPALDFIDEGQQVSCTTVAKLSMLCLVEEGTREVGLLLHFSGEDGVYFGVGVFEFTLG